MVACIAGTDSFIGRNYKDARVLVISPYKVVFTLRHRGHVGGQEQFCILFFVFYFLLHPIDKTLIVQYQLIQSCLNYVYIIIIIKEEIRMEKGTL